MNMLILSDDSKYDLEWATKQFELIHESFSPTRILTDLKTEFSRHAVQVMSKRLSTMFFHISPDNFDYNKELLSLAKSSTIFYQEKENVIEEKDLNSYIEYLHPFVDMVVCYINPEIDSQQKYIAHSLSLSDIIVVYNYFSGVVYNAK